MQNDNQQTDQKATEQTPPSEQGIPEVPAMQNRAGDELKEEHTETPTESGNISSESNDNANETIGTP
jgi:hypothetical protein